MRLGWCRFWVRAKQDRGTTRADPEQDRAVRGQDQDRTMQGQDRARCSTRQERQPPPLTHTHPGPGRLGSEGGDAGYGAVIAPPSRPALMAGSGSCTQNCKHFRNGILSYLICHILFGRLSPISTTAHIPDLAGRAQGEGMPDMAQLQHRAAQL